MDDITITGRAVDGGHSLFGDISITLPVGQWTCLLGVSGVGKSTLLRHVAGLPIHADFQGQVTGIDAAGVSYMAQDDLLMPWASVAHNIGLGARLRGVDPDPARIAVLMDRTGLAAHARKKPAQLSGGQRQRVALARTLYEDRPVVLLDEPFSSLDVKTRLDMQDLAVSLLCQSAPPRTILLVTHDPAEAARLGHQIIILNPARRRTDPRPHRHNPPRCQRCRKPSNSGPSSATATVVFVCMRSHMIILQPIPKLARFLTMIPPIAPPSFVHKYSRGFGGGSPQWTDIRPPSQVDGRLAKSTSGAG